MIGSCGFRGTPEAPRTLELGFSLRPMAWGRGFVQEAAAAVVRHARATLGLEQVLALTAPENVRARRTLERLGLASLEDLPDLAPFLPENIEDIEDENARA